MPRRAIARGSQTATRTTEAAKRHFSSARGGRSVGSEQREQQKLGAAARYFSILEHVAAASEPVDVLDLISTLDLPKATAYRLVEWLILQGYLSREPGRKRLIVGSKLTQLVLNVLSSSMRNDMPHDILRRLVQTVNETCNIGTLLSGEVVYLHRVEVEHWPLRLHFSVGSRVPIHCTAIGKLFLALSPESRRRSLLEHLNLRRLTKHTITSLSKLEAELRVIRREQVSFDREETIDGVVCAAVPILKNDGDLIAAVAIQAPEARMSVQAARKHLPALRMAAAELSKIYQQ